MGIKQKKVTGLDYLVSMSEKHPHISRNNISAIMKIASLNACGAYCDDCPHYRGKKKPACVGCKQSQGNPWWGECGLYKCALEKSVMHCGLCNEFPCDISATHFDPDNPAGQRNAVVRIGVLTYRAKHGDEKALERVEKLRTTKI